jgi:transcriptional regulator with XRE-family HTH domain
MIPVKKQNLIKAAKQRGMSVIQICKRYKVSNASVVKICKGVIKGGTPEAEDELRQALNITIQKRVEDNLDSTAEGKVIINQLTSELQTTNEIKTKLFNFHHKVLNWVNDNWGSLEYKDKIDLVKEVGKFYSGVANATSSRPNVKGFIPTSIENKYEKEIV